MTSGNKFFFKLGASALFCLAMLCASATAVPARSQAAAVASDDVSDMRACAKCHADEVKNFSTNPHATASLPNGKHNTCAVCHGPGTAHVASGGDPSKIINFVQLNAAQVDGLCLQCHGRGDAAFSQSDHGKARLSCISCHSIHVTGRSKSLLKSGKTELCLRCHADVKPQFSTPFHHKVEEGLIECTDCHNPHAASGTQFQASSLRQTAACTNCHTQTAGPFTYEHAPMETEGCTACHVPHGGPNPHLLIRAKVDVICEQCHIPAPDSASGAHLNTGVQSTANSKACTTCHIDIHGSDISEVFLRKN